MNPTRRRLLQQLISGGALAASGVSGLIREALAMGSQPVAPGIHKLRSNGRPARSGELVLRGDSVSTGPDG